MSISAEWGTARDTTITAVPGGNYPFSTEAQVIEQAALVFDPQSGGDFVLEGNVHDLAAHLDRAQRQLAPFPAADALAEWDSYCKHQNELMNVACEHSTANARSQAAPPPSEQRPAVGAPTQVIRR
ncbi:MAG: hypothetical protein L0H20_13810 [Corynebacterium sp.]|uniref:hypothetical protein n=1 Tax=Corynebacterium sp. TaxID=1720 RepID=UPI0026498CF7|nr:hypothetical protein [Corynebacterium sp.]MDN5724046.1 hypothetical protein [Corynebacterium sp.]